MLTGINVLVDAVCELCSFASVSASLFTGGDAVAVGTSKVGVGSPNRLTFGGTVLICFIRQ